MDKEKSSYVDTPLFSSGRLTSSWSHKLENRIFGQLFNEITYIPVMKSYTRKEKEEREVHTSNWIPEHIEWDGESQMCNFNALGSFWPRIATLYCSTSLYCSAHNEKIGYARERSAFFGTSRYFYFRECGSKRLIFLCLAVHCQDWTKKFYGVNQVEEVKNFDLRNKTFLSMLKD